MKFIHKALTSTAVATTAALSLFGSSAMAVSVTPNSNTNELLQALLGDTAGLSNFNITLTGNVPNGTGLFQNDNTFGLGSGVVLSTGDVSALVGPNDSGGTSGGGSSTQIDISFDADATADNLFFQYVFGSEEFKEFAGTGFNDKFELLLNGVNLAKLSDGQAVTINNLATTPDGPFHPDYIDNPLGGLGTELDGYTKALLFEGVLNKNASNTLSLVIQDIGDSSFDSAVFFKGNVGTVEPPETVPEPSVVLGLLTLGGMGLLKNRRKQQARVEQ